MLSIFSQFIFGSSSLFGKQHGDSKCSTWKDRSLCFDLSQSDLELNDGEQLIACFFPIEDIKGNQDEFGILSVTNLRLIWICCDKRRVNLSIGWRTVCLTFEQNLKDSLGSSVTSLCVLTKYESTKYEFIFNKMPAYNELWNSQDNWDAMIRLKRFMKKDKSLLVTHLTPMYLNEPFEVVFKVWQCYKQTFLFRHCRANLAQLVTNETTSMQALKVDDIMKLPNEEIIDSYPDILRHESRAIKYIGILILTNVRLIWIDETLQMRNLSIPYIKIESIKFKHNEKIIISTYDYLATSNSIEFRIQKSGHNQQQKKIKILFEQIQNLYSLYKAKPKFGPESCDDCINFISQLRPIENYFEPIERKVGQNLGPPANEAFMADIESVEIPGERNQNIDNDSEVKVEANENELTKYSQKLNSYLNEKPIERDMDLIYAADKDSVKPMVDSDSGSTFQMILRTVYRLAFLPSLSYNVALNKLNIRPWYNRVDDLVIIGALPWITIKDELIKTENVRRVVSMNENFELKWLSRWVANGDTWAQNNVEFLQLQTQDIFETPSQDKLKLGVDFILSNQVGHSVYVHCKAGRTRSATLVCCYLMKKNNWSPNQAHELLALKRPQLALHKPQWRALDQFYQENVVTKTDQ